ncbi:sulfatase [Mergibacter septicus]|uniref:Sulfatase n=2 Tax=Mergibacter septicus TaxID=221402 RepID=A0A8D4LPB0_9PAST|nr:sulfatase [Mergibacter septicus]QDJ15546.1 sulfatase [Mergibacter septicus]UTU48875.1 sulfatase-like hydrolase/transferase [Mergibacter septicus]
MQSSINLTFFLLVISFYLLFISFLIRKYMVNSYISQNIKDDPTYQESFRRMWWLGFRYDAKIIAIILTIPFIFGNFLFLFQVENTIVFKLISGYIFLISFLYIGILAGNYYYFQTYQNHYDIFMFGLIDDKTTAVLRNIWDDYPVIRFFISLFLLAFIPVLILLKIINNINFLPNSITLAITINCLMLISLAYFARGSFFNHPLGRLQAKVSSLSIINKMVVNGVIAIDWALDDRKQNILFEKVSSSEGQDLIQQALNIDSLIAKTEKNDYLADNPPHVVVTLMESLGSNFLAFDHPEKNNLLGKLRYYFTNSYLFSRFVSSYDGTAPSFASIYFHSPIQNISQSIAQKTSLPYTPFRIYKSKGYKTIFITGDNIAWRNFGNYLPLQGVDEIYDQTTILDLFPEAKEKMTYWGVADEFCFLLAEKLLKESTVPLFINILTITNHPPFQVPAGYQGYPVDENFIGDRLEIKKHDERSQILKTFQYAANALGEFFDRISCSEIADKTILAATGDHHMRSMKADLPKDLFLAKAVPFILHIPTAIQQQISLNYRPEIIGSHKDIMPTLYSISLSEVEYWHLGGRNLFAPQAEQYLNFGFNDSLWITNEAVYDLSNDQPVKYLWQDIEKLTVGDKPETISEAEIKQIHAYIKLLKWQINYHVMNGENSSL